MRTLATIVIAVVAAACSGSGGKAVPADTTLVPIDAAMPLALKAAFTANAATISTSEGAPYGDCDFWVATAAGCTKRTNAAAGYGPTRVIRIYICLSGEVSTADCSAQPAVTGPLSPTMLADIDTRLAAFEHTGLRLIVRFTYNFGPIGSGAMDAPIDVISSQLDQLAPILLKYQDLVIALEAGFIGTWGEWHDSTAGNDTPANEATVLDKESAAFGSAFPILVRDPGQLIQYLGGSTPSATFGLHDDYYDSSATDGATWTPCPTNNGYCLSGVTAAQLMAFAAAESTTTMFAGELGSADATLQTCAALDAFSYAYHAQSVSLTPPAAVATELAGEGCYGSFYNKVGTRIEITQATLAGAPVAGGQLTLGLTLVNTGYGRVIRARPATLVITSAGATVASLPIDLSALDLRTLAAAATPVPQTFTATVTLPAAFPATGTFAVSLLIPDPAPSLTADPLYALPLNSLDASGAPIFDATSGTNAIATFTR